MRLGGPLIQNYSDPDTWIAALRERGYRAAYCPVDHIDDMLHTYMQAARNAGILIAEVGVWNNPLNRDEQERRKAIDYCQQRLALADAIGALCCINISGSRGKIWDGPDPDNLTNETFDLQGQRKRAQYLDLRSASHLEKGTQARNDCPFWPGHRNSHQANAPNP